MKEKQEQSQTYSGKLTEFKENLYFKKMKKFVITFKKGRLVQTVVQTSDMMLHALQDFYEADYEYDQIISIIYFE